MAAGHGEAPKHEEGPSSSEYVLMAFSVGAACLGLWGARKAYAKAGPGYVEPINAVAPPLYRTLLNKYYVDELYDYLFTGREVDRRRRVWACRAWALHYGSLTPT